MGQIIAPGANSATTGPFGSSIGSRFFRTHGVPVIRGGNLSTDVGIRLRDIDLVFVSKEKATEFRRSTVRNGDLVFTCWGTINQIGLIDDSAAYPEYVISNKQMKLTPDHTRVLSEFLYFLFSGPAMQREILSGAIGSSIPGFNLGRLRSLKLLLPPLEEQQAIVRTLVDADNLSKSLERLITKKSAIRQSMTQQLLTGRARLPGFSGSWVSLHVAECSMLKARIGWQGLSKSEYKSGGIFRLIGGTGFVASLAPETIAHAIDSARSTVANKKIHLVAGACFLDDRVWKNSSFYFGPEGRLERYDKINLARSERGTFHPGNRLPVLEIHHEVPGDTLS